MRRNDDIRIRPAGGGDADAVRRLALLDSHRPLRGDVLVAEVDGRVLAALSLTTGDAVADPFERTAELVELLQVRAGSRPQARPARRFRPSPGYAGT